ncbi:MAG: ATP-binding protein, partial [Candidatus Omnitrophica bacterium]|nr:ATP-binding protein [Candidatus Omnitrophota bacterium]
MKRKAAAKSDRVKSGQLKIGDTWNAITIIALSQNNPLKAIAEFVENSIDAKAKKIMIIRGRSKGKTFLKIADNGEGVPKDKDGQPNFKYVATHICDSIKRQLKKEGIEGVQGEFGIGLLSFWTIGKALTLRSSGTDGQIYQMKMVRGTPGYHITKSRSFAPMEGTELVITDLLPGLRQLSGDKIQRYLASELRDRIRKSGIEVRVLDRVTRSEYLVEPRKFNGQLIHHKSILSEPFGEIYTEIYLNAPSQENHVALYRSGTRVVPSLDHLDVFDKEPWASQYFQGLIDAPFLNLTPGTRDGLIRDEQFSQFADALSSLEEQLNAIVAQQQQQQDEASNRHILKSVQKALREALLILPEEEYDWFEVYSKGNGPKQKEIADVMPYAVENFDSHQKLTQTTVEETPEDKQTQFFEYAGPLHRTQILPASCTLVIKQQRKL